MWSEVAASKDFVSNLIVFFSFVPRDILPVYVSNLEDERKNTKKIDKYKGKASSLPLPFLQLLP